MVFDKNKRLAKETLIAAKEQLMLELLFVARQ